MSRLGCLVAQFAVALLILIGSAFAAPDTPPTPVKSLDQLIEDFGHGNAEEQKAASTRLYLNGRKAIPALRPLTLHKNPDIAKRAQELLERIDVRVTNNPQIYASFSADGSHVLFSAGSAGDGHSGKYWLSLRNIKSNRDQAILEEHAGENPHVLLNAAGDYALISVNDRSKPEAGFFSTVTVYYWDLKQKKLRWSLENVGWPFVFLKDGRTAIVSIRRMPAKGEKNFFCPIMLLDLETGKVSKQLSGHTHPLRQVAITTDGRLALSIGSSAQPLRIWDLESGEEVNAIQTSDSINWAQFVPGHDWIVASVGHRKLVDGESKLTGSGLAIFDYKTGKELQRADAPDELPFNLVVSDDGKYAISMDRLWTLRLWELKKLRQIKKWDLDTDWVPAATFTPDGKKIRVAMPDSSIMDFDIPQ